MEEKITSAYIRQNGTPVTLDDGSVHYRCFKPATKEEIRQNVNNLFRVNEEIIARQFGRKWDECRFEYYDVTKGSEP